ncbi:ABC1 kinase family protein [Acetivibrio straminisolvens]|jgi:ubiquinone biosynthesis protein|uniref:Ubiquinone biosynthesis monooxygenase UbiB n=1 Tax=Acetivibrio straminisolvens JCM 21531 TaxID=1294263 RepID=W4V2Z0_9FIRM|nr:AarF/UbiB family protein [Acetivibrio straminisolvens]GAE87203.1 ubiquinone biosynthesis monooxygenase UbiB [Acetivibrio straminisolvens JCM 21531]
MVISKRVNIKRYKEIISVFAKHGFGLLFDQLGIFDYLKMGKKISSDEGEDDSSRLSMGERIRLSCEELGPTFVKIGQILSTRPDVVPSDIIEELKKLQESVHPFSFDEVRTVIESEFEDKLENIYLEFSKEPIAAASISQVHCAKLKSGEKVAVKVQRPGIERNIALDLNILKDLVHFIENHTKYGKIYDLIGMVIDFENTIKNELDFTREGENAETFRKNFAKEGIARVPEINWTYTTRRVLTMEYIEGIEIGDIEGLEKAGIDKVELAKNLATSICNQVLTDGFYHADPHPGNIRILRDGTIVFLDLGMVGKISESRKKIISNFFVGVSTKNSKIVARAIVDLGEMSERRNLKRFEKDIDRMIDKYIAMPWSEIKIVDLFYEVFNIAFVNEIKIPREFAMLAKTLGTAQGVLEKLAPDLNTIEIAKPIAKKLIYQSFSIKNVTDSIKKNALNYRDVVDLFSEFPSILLGILEKYEDRDYTLQLGIKDIDKIMKRLDRNFNRMSLSVVLLAVSIIITGIIIGSSQSASPGSEMYFVNVMALRIGLGVVVAIILGLVISMFRSNHF